MDHEQIGGARVANPDGHIPEGEYNPHNIRAWLIGAEYGALAIAFASNEQDAIDEAVDAGLLDSLMLKPDMVAERTDQENGDEFDMMRAGNAGEPFDTSYLWIREIPYPVACVQD